MGQRTEDAAAIGPDTLKYVSNELEDEVLLLKQKLAAVEVDRDRAHAFASWVEKADTRFVQLCDKYIVEIAEMMRGIKGTEESIADAVRRVLQERDEFRERAQDLDRIAALEPLQRGVRESVYDAVARIMVQRAEARERADNFKAKWEQAERIARTSISRESYNMMVDERDEMKRMRDVSNDIVGAMRATLLPITAEHEKIRKANEGHPGMAQGPCMCPICKMMLNFSAEAKAFTAPDWPLTSSGEKKPITSIVADALKFAIPPGTWWVISGRLCGNDEDMTSIITAENRDTAEDAFAEELLGDSYEPLWRTRGHSADDDRTYPKVFINAVTRCALKPETLQ